MLVCIMYAGCKSTAPVQSSDVKGLPKAFNEISDSTNMADIKWKDFFADKNLQSLIDTALKNNVELMITLQEIEIAKSELKFKKGMLFPNVSAGVGYSNEKVGRYTSEGAGDAVTEITPGRLFPDTLSDY